MRTASPSPPGPMHSSLSEDLDRANEAFVAADILLLQLESPMETVEAALRKARARGVPVILNPAPARPLDDAILGLVSVLTPNEHEAEILTGIAVTDERAAREAASRLGARGPASVVDHLGGARSLCLIGRVRGTCPGVPAWMPWTPRRPATSSTAPWRWRWPKAFRWPTPSASLRPPRPFRSRVPAPSPRPPPAQRSSVYLIDRGPARSKPGMPEG